ncbi:MAG: thioredoxin [Mycoplasmataceae bacterium]|jgi:thioredoxin 1|nr:thioredoxin [Mycoplasmataceae bacterium]
MQKLNSKNFSKSIEKNTWVVDFYADWCGPCKMLSPIFENVAKKYPKINFTKINVDESNDIAEKYNVLSIPTIIVFKDGKKYSQHVGFISEEKLIDLFNK